MVRSPWLKQIQGEKKKEGRSEQANTHVTRNEKTGDVKAKKFARKDRQEIERQTRKHTETKEKRKTEGKIGEQTKKQKITKKRMRE